MIDHRSASPASSRVLRAFWLLGLLNNAPWVLMLAVATDISAGGVALVFLSNQVPGLLVKLTAPCWFPATSYRARIFAASVAMATACVLVGCGGQVRGNARAGEEGEKGSWGLALELLGVSFISFSCSLGEVSDPMPA